ncbi:hypothetical protein M0R45_022905 [Rubus argutus]|uniref:Uncharacterized protein n=1 Tax=Rubus argutus TaxID=59490 RepID=A0AAW1WPS3_RUBAR
MLSWEKLGPKIEKKEKSYKSCCGNQNQRRQQQEKEERKLNMSVLLVNVPSRAQPLWKSKTSALPGKLSPSNTRSVRLGSNHVVKAFFSNPIEEPIVRKALQEPVAFMGGMFAGLLRLDLNEDPLKDWVSRTVEASGITVEEIDADGLKPEEDSPQQIEIE